ncbi:MAG: hypothetical protein DHS20C18_46340 [Saprospiraceae bacterium]|nr:MAG: hypothetical protein DHS20C18_46340 [Saprospiraceae bacterium]
MKVRLLILMLCILGTSLVAQNATYRQLNLENYTKGKTSMVVLKDELNLIPIQRLDTLRIAYLPVGLLANHRFQEELEKYSQLEILSIYQKGINPENWWKNQQKDFDLYILGIDGSRPKSDDPEYMLFAPILTDLVKNYKTIAYVTEGMDIFQDLPIIEEATTLVVNGRGGVLATTSGMTQPKDHLYPLPPVKDADGKLLPNWRDKSIAKPNTSGEMVQNLVADLGAQLLFGALGTKQRLAENLSDRFQAGSGMDKPGGLRLGYAPPEAVGMDGQLLKDSIMAILNAGIEAGAFPGAQVLVAKKGQIVYHEGYGFHTYDEQRPVLTSDIYDFASVTKTTSALLGVMQLYDRGKFKLDTPLKTYFPNFSHSNKGDLPFREMLAHQSRLRPWIPYWQGTLKGHGRYPWKKRWDGLRTNDYRFRHKSFARDSSANYNIYITDNLWLHKDYKEKIDKAIRKSPLNEKAEYVYSGLLFYLLPEMVARLTHEDYEGYLNNHFYHRLGAYTLTYNPLRFYPLDRIVPTERDTFFRMVQIHGHVHDEGAAMMGGVSANAGLFGSANDLAKLAQMYLNMGEYGGERYIEEATLREFTRCQYCELGNRRGLGFDKPLIEYDAKTSSVAEAASPESFGHSGYTGTFYWVDPKEELIYIFFSNRVFPTRNNRKIYELNIRPRVHEVLYQAILSPEN